MLFMPYDTGHTVHRTKPSCSILWRWMPMINGPVSQWKKTSLKTNGLWTMDSDRERVARAALYSEGIPLTSKILMVHAVS